MNYIVIRGFIDSQDEMYDYNIGDTYPRKGKKVSKNRIEELLSDKRKKPFIEVVND